MQSWISDFIEQHKSKGAYQYQPLPEYALDKQLEWIFSSSGAPWLELHGLDVPYSDMYKEGMALIEMFVPHRSSDSQGWASLCVHGVGATITSRPEDHGLDSSKVTYQWTEIADRCPVTVAYFRDRFPFNSYQRLRFMLVQPGGYIAPHSDNALNHLGAAVNISLNHPEGCVMTTEFGSVPFRDEGSVFLFNNHYRHAVHNPSDQARLHMIVHGSWRMPDWAKIVVNSYRKACDG